MAAADAGLDRYRTSGGSMFPAIPAGAIVAVERVEPSRIRPGDVLCHPALGGAVVAHRVVRIEDGPDGRAIVTRGDGGTAEDRVPESAAIHVVRRVEHRLFAYDSDGPVGRALATAALSDGPAWRTARRALRLAVGAASLARDLAGLG